jgi:hypothetical protein
MQYSDDLQLAASLQMQHERRDFQHKLQQKGYGASLAIAAVGVFISQPALFLPVAAVFICEIGLGAAHKGGQKKLARGEAFAVAIRCLDAEYQTPDAQAALLNKHRARVDEIKAAKP